MNTIQRWAPWVLAGVLFIVYSIFSVSRFEHFVLPSWDLAIFEEAIRNYAYLKAPIVHIKGLNYNLLGDHFSPLLVVFAPLYRLFPSAVTLLIAQAALFAVSTVPVTRLGIRLLGTGQGISIGLAYGLSWGVQRALGFEFHEICLAVPLLAFSLEALVLKQWRTAAGWALPLVLVKEDLGLTVAAIGLCLFLAKARRLGVVLGIFGLAACIVAMGLIIPMINPQGHYSYFSKLGSGFSGQGSLVKLQTLGLIFGITGFLALRSPVAIVALPTLLWRFLSNDPHFWGTEWHYNAVIMPAIFIALIDAIERIRLSGPNWLKTYQRIAIPMVLMIALLLCSQNPLGDLLKPETYKSNSRIEAAHGALAFIPNGVTVESDVGLMAHLTNHTDVYWIGNTGDLAPTYIAIDQDSGGWSFLPDDWTAYAQYLHPRITYRLVYSNLGYEVLQRIA